MSNLFLRKNTRRTTQQASKSTAPSTIPMRRPIHYDLKYNYEFKWCDYECYDTTIILEYLPMNEVLESLTSTTSKLTCCILLLGACRLNRRLQQYPRIKGQFKKDKRLHLDFQERNMIHLMNGD